MKIHSITSGAAEAMITDMLFMINEAVRVVEADDEFKHMSKRDLIKALFQTGFMAAMEYQAFALNNTLTIIKESHNEPDRV